MDDLRFYVLFNSISVLSGRWANDNELLCAMEPRLQLKKIRLERDSNSGRLDQQASALPTELPGILVTHTAELKWLEHIGNHENMFETGVFDLMSVNQSARSGGTIGIFSCFSLI